MEESNKKYPEGHFVGMWMGIGIAIFSGIGVPLSVLLKTPGLMAIGPAAGVAFGLALGESIETKYKKEGRIRPLTREEKNQRRLLVVAGIALFLIGLTTLLMPFLLR